MDRTPSCDSIWDMLSAYADSEATSEEAARVERHVADCADCARDLAFMRATASTLAETPEVVPPPDLRQAILAATIYRPTWPQRFRNALRPLLSPPGLGLAGATAILLLLFLLYGPTPSTLDHISRRAVPTPKRMARNEPTPPALSSRRAAPKPLPSIEAASPPAPRKPLSAPPILLADLRAETVSKPPRSGSVQHPESPDAGGKRHAAAPRFGGRKPAAPILRPEIEPPYVDTSDMAEMTPEERRMMEEGMKVAAADPNPKEKETTADRKPVPPASDGGRIRLIAASAPMGAGAASSLAELRRNLRRDSDFPVSSALYSVDERREMTMNVIRTRF